MESHRIIHPNSLAAWILAARPKTLTASVIPVVLGTFLALSMQGSVNWSFMGYAILSAISIQIGINLVNDAIDFKKGADSNDRLGPKRATQCGWLTPQQVLTGAFVAFSCGLAAGLPLINLMGMSMLVILAICILLGYLYTGGPYPLAYHGLGDLFVILFFGLLATSVSYYIQTKTLNFYPFLAGTQIGFLATVLIAINNLRDIEEDTKSKKRTLAVRYGKTFARYEITAMALLPFVLGLCWFAFERPFAAILPWLSFPGAFVIVSKVWKYEPGHSYNQFLGMGALLHLLFGLLLSLGLCLHTT